MLCLRIVFKWNSRWEKIWSSNAWKWAFISGSNDCCRRY